MIAGIFHQGSGLGNQLHRYVATRVLALDKGYEFAMEAPELFKGKDFMDIKTQSASYAYGQLYFANRWQEKKVVENNVDIRGYDPEINFIEDNTIIDGEFQDPRYFEHRLKEIDEWLKVEPIHSLAGESMEDVCVIGFRGGEFTAFPDLFLTKDYWEEGMAAIKKQNPNVVFEVHTDDYETAKKFFPDFRVIHGIDINWRSMRYAKYAIIANSSFFILPRLLNDGVTIAPRYWARRNIKTWSMPQNYYKQFTYI